jgi:hypothetical protein
MWGTVAVPRSWCYQSWPGHGHVMTRDYSWQPRQPGGHKIGDRSLTVPIKRYRRLVPVANKRWVGFNRVWMIVNAQSTP